MQIGLGRSYNPAGEQDLKTLMQCRLCETLAGVTATQHQEAPRWVDTRCRHEYTCTTCGIFSSPMAVSMFAAPGLVGSGGPVRHRGRDGLGPVHRLVWSPVLLGRALLAVVRGHLSTTLVGLLLLAAALLAPPAPHDQAAICQRHNGPEVCRVW